MQQIADWLEKLGLGQYAQRFAENDVSFAVLPDLTDQDLKELGVSLGQRRQILRAIAERNGVQTRGFRVGRSVTSLAAWVIPYHAAPLGSRITLGRLVSYWMLACPSPRGTWLIRKR
jgi:SAM (Sterile alpha motif) domain-containing protein